MCDYRRHVSYIIIKDTRGSLIKYIIMYFNYTLFKLYVYANIFFIAQVWFWGRGQLVFWGASKFLGGPVSFQIYWPPGPLHPQAQCQGLISILHTDLYKYKAHVNNNTSQLIGYGWLHYF